MQIENPIRRGFYPDPSICRVDKKYYCAHSSFAYAPGVPVFESENLTEWKQIGHVLTSDTQLPLDGQRIKEGIYAPSLRYHEGVFYMITTNIGAGGNFYVTAKDPKGPWSEPHFIEGADGIDPDLFFDNGKCYYVGQHQKPDSDAWGDCEIWIQELDLETGKLLGTQRALWDGTRKQSYWPEGPHLYKKGSYYYLMIAECGTEFEHSICVARSESLFGPYENCPNNPIMTHRHLGQKYPIQNVGHGDLVETPEGDWYIVTLGVRCENNCTELGRETFLADVIWENDWPVINAGEGRIRNWQEVKNVSEPVSYLKKKNRTDYIWGKEPDQRLIGLRKLVLTDASYGCKFDGGNLFLPFGKAELSDRKVVSFVGVRMEERTFSFRTKMQCELTPGLEAGLVCFFDEDNSVRFTVERKDQTCYGQVIERKLGEEKIIYQSPLAKKNVEALSDVSKKMAMELRGKDQKLTMVLGGEICMTQVDMSYLCSRFTGGFTGCVLGIYASAHKKESQKGVWFAPLQVSFEA